MVDSGMEGWSFQPFFYFIHYCGMRPLLGPQIPQTEQMGHNGDAGLALGGDHTAARCYLFAYGIGLKLFIMRLKSSIYISCSCSDDVTVQL